MASSSGVAVLSIFDSAPTFTTLTHDKVIDVSTDKSVYKQGETVTVIITNIGETRIEITGPCFTVYNEHWETVFSGCLFWYLVLESGESEELFKGMNARYLPTGHIVYLRNNILYARPFDPDTLKVTGGEFAVEEGTGAWDISDWAIRDWDV